MQGNAASHGTLFTDCPSQVRVFRDFPYVLQRDIQEAVGDPLQLLEQSCRLRRAHGS